MAPIAVPFTSDVRDLLLIVAGLWLFNRFVIVPRRDPLRKWIGPKPDSWVMGNLRKIFQGAPGEIHLKWSRQFGSVVRYWGFLGESRLVISDPAALTHILLQHSYDYPKPAQVRGELGRILGRGVLFAEGDDHRRQRRVMQPAFNKPQTDALVPLFFQQAKRLVPIWAAEVDASSEESGPVIDVTKDLSRLTLDLIGLAGFGTDFKSLDRDDEQSPLANAFSSMFKASTPGFPLSRILAIVLMRYLPIIAKLPNKRLKAITASFGVMSTEAQKLIDGARERIAAGDEGGKDLLSLLMRSNMSETAKVRMTDDEVAGQITTILLAGHETTSTALTWILHLLSTRPKMQQRLRKEVCQAFARARERGQEHPSADELQALPYLDAVCREGLRFIPPVTSTIRTAEHDDMVPLHKPVTLPNGTVASAVPVRKGMTIFISVIAINFDKAVFGEDADDFNPDRWLDNNFSAAFEGAKGFSTWHPLLTFLGGPRSCIGYRFAVSEYKAILATIISSFSFAPRDDATRIESHSQIVTRPYVVGDVNSGSMMPLRVTRAA